VRLEAEELAEPAEPEPVEEPADTAEERPAAEADHSPVAGTVLAEEPADTAEVQERLEAEPAVHPESVSSPLEQTLQR